MGSTRHKLRLHHNVRSKLCKTFRSLAIEFSGRDYRRHARNERNRRAGVWLVLALTGPFVAVFYAGFSFSAKTASSNLLNRVPPAGRTHAAKARGDCRDFQGGLVGPCAARPDKDFRRWPALLSTETRGACSRISR